MKHHHPNASHAQLYFIVKPDDSLLRSSVNTCEVLRCVSHVCYLSFSLFSHFCSLLHFFIHNKERNAVIVLFLPKPPLENIGHLKVNSHGKAPHGWPGTPRITREAWAAALTFLLPAICSVSLKGPWIHIFLWVSQSQSSMNQFRSSGRVKVNRNILPCILKANLISIMKRKNVGEVTLKRRAIDLDYE